ncbi:hypothetical protein PENTCL1PPCAC_10104, partial [Pristionchus entomophagus]
FQSARATKPPRFASHGRCRVKVCYVAISPSDSDGHRRLLLRRQHHRQPSRRAGDLLRTLHASDDRGRRSGDCGAIEYQKRDAPQGRHRRVSESARPQAATVQATRRNGAGYRPSDGTSADRSRALRACLPARRQLASLHGFEEFRSRPARSGANTSDVANMASVPGWMGVQPLVVRARGGEGATVIPTIAPGPSN